MGRETPVIIDGRNVIEPDEYIKAGPGLCMKGLEEGIRIAI